MFYFQDEFLGEVHCNRELINQLARHTDRHLSQYRMEAAEQFEQDREFLLDAVDFSLGLLSPDSYEATESVAKLNDHLAEARSAYPVSLDGNGQYELQYRQPEALTALVAEATSGTDRAREHLRRAWSKAFGRKADPNGACLDAVAAIEVAARPIVSPNNAKSTLGALIRDMKAKPTKWTTSSNADDDIGKVISMMDMAWTGHFRHGEHTGRYRPLSEWLRRQDGQLIRLTFTELEERTGITLPEPCRHHVAQWTSYQESLVARAIIDAGWYAGEVNLDGTTVVRSPEEPLSSS